MVWENMRRGDSEQAARWAWLAGFHASRNVFFGTVADPALEDQLLTIGRALPTPLRRAEKSGRPRYLHVLTETYATGGHTRLCRRWIELDWLRHRHSVVLTAQVQSLPEDFRQSVIRHGGELVVLDPSAPLVDRALQLRRLVCERADVVVLHTHPEDTIAIMAFAVEGVPPVVLLNHADHLFWFGGSIADLVLDFRQSGQERTKECRGIRDSVILPIPLGQHSLTDEVLRPDRAARQCERARLGIPEDAVVFLTVGWPDRYNAHANYDFVAAAIEILNACPRSYLVAVGPSNQGNWAAASAKCGGRLKALGRALDFRPCHAAADIYLEGFPWGSGTALLEAGLAGLPCIRSPILSTSLGRMDDLSIDYLPSPSDVGEYVGAAVEMAAAAGKRQDDGRRLQQTIIEHHCGEGWLRHLQVVESRIPTGHQIYVRRPCSLPKAEKTYLSAVRRELIARSGWPDWLGRLYAVAQHQNLPVRGGVDRELRQSILAMRCENSDESGAPTNWFRDCLVTDAHLAYQQKDWCRLRKDFLACLRIDPLSEQNRQLAGPVVESFIGSRRAQQLRALKRYLRGENTPEQPRVT